MKVDLNLITIIFYLRKSRKTINSEKDDPLRVIKNIM